MTDLDAALNLLGLIMIVPVTGLTFVLAATFGVKLYSIAREITLKKEKEQAAQTDNNKQ